MVPAALWLWLGAGGDGHWVWPGCTKASTGRYGCPAAYGRCEAGSLSRQPARPGNMAGTVPHNTVMGPALARSVTPALITRFYSPPLVCCSHVHTTSMVRWSDSARPMSDPLDERPVERGDSPGNLPRSLVVLIPSLSSRREPR